MGMVASDRSDADTIKNPAINDNKAEVVHAMMESCPIATRERERGFPRLSISAQQAPPHHDAYLHVTIVLAKRVAPWISSFSSLLRSMSDT